MPDFDIDSQSGEQFSFGGQITKPATVGQQPPWPNYPTTAAGFSVRFTAKRRKSDAQALVQKESGVSADVSLQNGGAWSVRIVAADTSSFSRTEDLAYDVALIEPTGERTVICKGRWTVDKSVGL